MVYLYTINKTNYYEQNNRNKSRRITITTDWDIIDARRDKANEMDLLSCPCCGKGIKNEKYFINSAFGGSAYIPINEDYLADTWEMAVGSECRKLFPKGYVFTK